MIKQLDISYRDLEEKVEIWAQEKGILDKATPIRQAEKTLEEVNELIDALKEDDLEETRDALGDILVTIIIQAKLKNVDLLECLQGAYNIISKRTGKMINGQFVKDE
jgi:NTP pyrophosphatase (non-canonical NTP hydrolase)